MAVASAAQVGEASELSWFGLPALSLGGRAPAWGPRAHHNAASTRMGDGQANLAVDPRERTSQGLSSGPIPIGPAGVETGDPIRGGRPPRELTCVARSGFRHAQTVLMMGRIAAVRRRRNRSGATREGFVGLLTDHVP